MMMLAGNTCKVCLQGDVSAPYFGLPGVYLLCLWTVWLFCSELKQQPLAQAAADSPVSRKLYCCNAVDLKQQHAAQHSPHGPLPMPLTAEPVLLVAELQLT
jgi:hypothetical protein